jgi:hypothetical protein
MSYPGLKPLTAVLYLESSLQYGVSKPFDCLMQVSIPWLELNHVWKVIGTVASEQWPDPDCTYLG